MSNSKFYQDGQDQLSRGKSFEEAQDYHGAYQAYLNAAESFNSELKHCALEEQRKVLENGVGLIISRAEEIWGIYLSPQAQARLKQEERQRKKTSPSPAAAAAPPATNARPRSSGKKEGQGASHRIPSGSGGGGSSSSSHDRPESIDEETQKLYDIIDRTIITKNTGVTMDTVVGLVEAKAALQEAIVGPELFPEYFTGQRKPWKGILLFGPSGTGKSLLAKAAAASFDRTFLSVSTADLSSKWHGESEKLVRCLFDRARELGPSIVFIDEVDSLCSTRTDKDSEAARNVKNELLVRLDGLTNDCGEDSQVLLIAATNLPHQLDGAMLRRFDRRIFVRLPNLQERLQMLKKGLAGISHTITDGQLRDVSELLDGYSGSDIANILKDALYGPLRRILAATHFRPGLVEVGSSNAGHRYVYWPCKPEEPIAMRITAQEIKARGWTLCDLPCTYDDLCAALVAVRPARQTVPVDEYLAFAVAE